MYPVLRFRDVYPGSEFFPSRIRFKEFYFFFNPKKWFLSSRKYDPGCSPRIRFPVLLVFAKISKDPDLGGQLITDSSGSGTLLKIYPLIRLAAFFHCVTPLALSPNCFFEADPCLCCPLLPREEFVQHGYLLYTKYRIAADSFNFQAVLGIRIAGSACFWASRIRIHKSEVRIRILPFSEIMLT